MKIPFNKPPRTGSEDRFVLESLDNVKISGDGVFTRRCEGWFQEKLGVKRTLMTPSCTAALEMSAILMNIKPGDEVIMPSYTFVSTANAFALRGAKIIFVDIRPDTMNIDETKIEDAISSRTRAIVVVHYAGVGCEMEKIIDIAKKRGLTVIEDAAQAVGATYKGKALGTFGALGTFSFHETKNLTSGGEGGLLVVNDPNFVDKAEIIREKGTNRSLFFKGFVDKYTWVDIGSSYLASDLQAAYLWGQLQDEQLILDTRMASWQRYDKMLTNLFKKGDLEHPTIPESCQHNAHMFYVKTNDLKARDELIEHLKNKSICAVFHYVPLHSSPAGMQFGSFSGNDEFTTNESNRLVRLPLWYGMHESEQQTVVDEIENFFGA